MSISPKLFEITLIDLNEKLCEEWKKSFNEFSDIKIINGKFEYVKDFDCLVSPANSFGLMDGGIDLAIRNYFGMTVQYNVQKRIQKEFYGEQPVGTSIIVFTENEFHPFLAHTPTMRVPTDISKTDNVYNAFFAMLTSVANYNKNNKIRIETVLCPGLGTATGRMTPKEASRQMLTAYKNFIKPTTNMNWKNLNKRHKEIIG
ncbi:putative phosphatase, C-terminal domain of histone macro H2A1 like protein [Bernardetia litoralis DSM 6794]|uniref:Putative phosphatase, C-terminal domain of histone macro H2A1 like protein n=1 Tax=Bernardetia litoralis (strain ATCC 23117 / DSM 6794 / NBRC 15988 / NCIMB 1366 / Fx l1 / Sio-4) TaxID=880071 RepID=I4ANW3_BERLS|nr:macro domain-containing protein [Bernardetia litoralis]AFM05648.1 putative phosphatase, C-terminal domain of histone macro H2A1 like protein [Bernardetia litoralis DSM 6794]